MDRCQRPRLHVFALTVVLQEVMARKTAVVLQGGGAKGAFQVGVLHGLCRDPDFADSWSLIAGTSIGALNAGFLTQFSQDRQCSEAVPGLEMAWRSFGSVGDLMVRSGTEEPCNGMPDSSWTLRRASYVLQELWNQNSGGFTCDNRPGREWYTRWVDPALIKNSSMQLGAPAVDLDTGVEHYFTDADDEETIFNGTLASGSLVPLVAPTFVNGRRYMDGGARTNLPLLHALSRGADRAIAVLLKPLGRHAFPQQEQPTQLSERLEFLMATVFEAEFDKEVREACLRFPKAEIMAAIPTEGLGGLLAFDPEAIAGSLAMGKEGNFRLLKDYCSEMGYERGQEVIRLEAERDAAALQLNLSQATALEELARLRADFAEELRGAKIRAALELDRHRALGKATEADLGRVRGLLSETAEARRLSRRAQTKTSAEAARVRSGALALSCAFAALLVFASLPAISAVPQPLRRVEQKLTPANVWAALAWRGLRLSQPAAVQPAALQPALAEATAATRAEAAAAEEDDVLPEEELERLRLEAWSEDPNFVTALAGEAEQPPAAVLKEVSPLADDEKTPSLLVEAIKPPAATKEASKLFGSDRCAPKPSQTVSAGRRMGNYVRSLVGIRVASRVVNRLTRTESLDLTATRRQPLSPRLQRADTLPSRRRSNFYGQAQELSQTSWSTDSTTDSSSPSLYWEY